MPTGYGFLIEEGCSFEVFVWECALSTVYCNNLRESEEESSRWDKESLRECQDELRKLFRMTAEEAEREIREVNERRQREYAEILRDFQMKDSLYQAMNDRVESWIPPSPAHESLKGFLLDQIRLSRPYRPFPTLLESGPPERYLERARESLEKAIEYYKDRIGRASLVRKEALEWVRLLQESVPKPSNMVEPPGR